MNRLSKKAILGALAMGMITLSQTGAYAALGPTVWSGADSDDHPDGGPVDNGDGTFSNLGGTLFMQRTIEKLAENTSNGKKVVVQLGADAGPGAGDEAANAFNFSSLPGTGWTQQFVNGTSAIEQFFKMSGDSGFDGNALHLSDVGIIMLDSSEQVTGGISDGEQMIIADNVNKVKDYVFGGGGLFGQVANLGLLQALHPGITLVDAGAPNSEPASTQTLEFTTAGSAFYSPITASEIINGANPANRYHVSFGGDLSGVVVLANDIADPNTPKPMLISLFPDPELAATGVDIGNVRVGTNKTGDVVAKNNTAGIITGVSIGPATGGDGDIQPDTGSAAIPDLVGNGAMGMRTFTYTPSARGADSTDVEVLSDSGSTTVTVKGNGVSPEFAAALGSANGPDPSGMLLFDNLDPNCMQTLHLFLKNVSPDGDLGALTDMTIVAAQLTDPNGLFSLLSNPVGEVISVGGSFDLEIKFTAPMVPGVNLSDLQGVLVFTTDVGVALGQAGQQFTFELQGTPWIPPSNTGGTTTGGQTTGGNTTGGSTGTPGAVPEPVTGSLALLGLAGLGVWTTSRRRTA